MGVFVRAPRPICCQGEHVVSRSNIIIEPMRRGKAALRVVSGAASFSSGPDTFASVLIQWRMLFLSQDPWRTRVFVNGAARGRWEIGGLPSVQESAAVVGIQRPQKALCRVQVGKYTDTKPVQRLPKRRFPHDRARRALENAAVAAMDSKERYPPFYWERGAAIETIRRR